MRFCGGGGGGDSDVTVVAFGGQPLPLRAARREKTEIDQCQSVVVWW
jgi:hypothetical protein